MNCARAVNRELIQIHEPGCNHLSNSISNLFCALSSLKVRDQRYISTMSRVVEERKVIGQVLQFRKLPQFLGVGEVIQRNLKLFRTACSSVVHTRNEGTQDVRPLLKIFEVTASSSEVIKSKRPAMPSQTAHHSTTVAFS